MNILMDISQPQHVHLFKNFAHETQRKEHHILFLYGEKEFEIDLLKVNYYIARSACLVSQGTRI